METNIQVETLTMEEAISKGYTHFVEEQGSFIRKLSPSITSEERQYLREGKYFIVDKENPNHYTQTITLCFKAISKLDGEIF